MRAIGERMMHNLRAEANTLLLDGICDQSPGIQLYRRIKYILWVRYKYLQLNYTTRIVKLYPFRDKRDNKNMFLFINSKKMLKT